MYIDDGVLLLYPGRTDFVGYLSLYIYVLIILLSLHNSVCISVSLLLVVIGKL